MPGGIWEAIGAALQQGVGTYQNVSRDQQRQRLAEEESRRQNEWQQAQLERQRQDMERSDEDRKIKQLHDAITLANPGDDLSGFESEIRATAPHLLPALKIGGGQAEQTAPVASGVGFGLGGPLQLPAPKTVTRKASLGEQAAQIQIETGQTELDQKKKNAEIAQKLTDAIAAGTLRDTPANRMKLAQYTSVNPNEVWGTIEHPSRAGSGRGGQVSGLAQAVLANPPLYEQLTPTAKTAIAPELAAAGFDFAKSMNASGIKFMAEANAAVEGARSLEAALAADKGDASGPIQGLAGYLPDTDFTQDWFDTRDVKKMQSLIDLQRQRIGKLFEGGVLRKEDEVKYAKILPTTMDHPETQARKMQNVIATLEADIASYIEQQQIAGRRVNVQVPIRDPQGGNVVQQQQGAQAPTKAPAKSRYEVIEVR